MNFKTVFLEVMRTEPINNWAQLLQSDPYLLTAVELMGKIEALGGEALIVGGAVRDILLKKPAHDIDIATNVDVDIIGQHFKTHDIGKSRDFGIVNVLYGDYAFEIANYRAEAGYSDNRRPDIIHKVKSFEKDSERRDLTFNALGLDRHGTIIDYQNGIEDLQNKIVRAVGNAQERFIEDSLRLIRVARFAAKFGFQIEPETRQAMVDLSHLVDNVSAERIHDELFKIAEVSGEALANYLEHLDNVGILQRMLPEIHVMHDFEHTPATHPEGGVFKHTMAALRASESRDPITNLGILFHDVGKPVTRGYTDSEGKPNRGIGTVSYKWSQYSPFYPKIL